MQQEKMGCLLRELRKERGMTQEQMAELFNVSNRTVSRWENGINMPDISVLVEMANYFDVGILELIEGERKEQVMIIEDKNGLEKIADYADEQKGIVIRNVHRKDVICLISYVLATLALEGYVEFGYSMLILLQVIFMGIGVAMLMINIGYTTGIDAALSQYRKKHRWPLFVLIAIFLVTLVALCKDAYLVLTLY